MSKHIPNLQLEQIKELFLRTHGEVYKNEIIDHLKMNDPFYFLRGTKAESAITVKQSIDSTELVIPKLNYENLQPYFRGTDTTNKGVAPSVDSMNVKQSFVKLKMMTYDHRYVKPQLGMDFISQMYANLKNGIAQMHISQVYNQFAKCFAQNALYYANKPNVNELKTDEFYYTNYIIEGTIPFQQNVPAYIPVCGVDTPNAAGDVVSFDRCVFGGDQLLITAPIGGGGATIAAQIANAGLFGNETAADINDRDSAILTVSHLQRMIELARIGSRITGTEDSVYPLITTSFNNTPAMGYVIFISRDAFEGLRRTSEYQQQINRAFREVVGQPSLYNGSNFVMQIGNTDVYVSDLLSQMQFTTPTTTTAAGAKINYSVLMGKQAIVQIDSPTMEIADWKTETNYNQDTFEIFYDEMTGYKPIRFKAKNINKPNSLVDRGLVHSFTLSPQNLA
jgi:hypothetical protein